MLDKSRIIEGKFVNNRPGYKWLILFEKRHSDEISRRTAQILTPRRADVTVENITLWFAYIRKYLLSTDLFHILNEPRRVSFNSRLISYAVERTFNVTYGQHSFSDF